MIREADLADLPALLEMGRKFHAVSPWKAIPLSEERLADSFRGQISNASSTILVNDELTAMLCMVSGGVYFADGVTVAQETSWWSEDPRTSILLLSAAEQWARDIGADFACMARLEGVTPRLEAFYERRGYAPTEHYHLKAL